MAEKGSGPSPDLSKNKKSRFLTDSFIGSLDTIII